MRIKRAQLQSGPMPKRGKGRRRRKRSNLQFQIYRCLFIVWPAPGVPFFGQNRQPTAIEIPEKTVTFRLVDFRSFKPSNPSESFDPRGSFKLFALIGLLSLILPPISGVAQSTTPPLYHPNQILVKPKSTSVPAALSQFHKAHKTTVLRTFNAIGGLQVITVPPGESVPNLVAKYEASGLVEFAEPDYVAEILSTT